MKLSWPREGREVSLVSTFPAAVTPVLSPDLGSDERGGQRNSLVAKSGFSLIQVVYCSFSDVTEDAQIPQDAVSPKNPLLFPTHPLNSPSTLKLSPNISPNLLSFHAAVDYRSPEKGPRGSPETVPQWLNPLGGMKEANEQGAKQVLFSRQERTKAGNPHLWLFLIT